ncbi:putative nucleic acid-binding protein [Pedobacter sp. UYP24]
MNLSDATQTVVITDTSCLIILDKLELLHILQKLFSVVLTTPEIAEEFGAQFPDWIVVISVRDKSLQQKFLEMVDPGEASAIALAHEINNQYLITDDLAARKLAITIGLPVIGTLGVLIRAKSYGIIPLVKPVIEQMKQTNFRVSEALFATTLQQARE